MRQELGNWGALAGEFRLGPAHRGLLPHIHEAVGERTPEKVLCVLSGLLRNTGPFTWGSAVSAGLCPPPPCHVLDHLILFPPFSNETFQADRKFCKGS